MQKELNTFFLTKIFASQFNNFKFAQRKNSIHLIKEKLVKIQETYSKTIFDGIKSHKLK